MALLEQQMDLNVSHTNDGLIKEKNLTIAKMVM